MKILHIITGLGDGGAEGVLTRLCTNSEYVDHVVISLTDEGKYGAQLRKAGIDVHCLNISKNFNSILSFWQLYKLIKLIKPQVIQTWMYHADLLGGVAAKFAGVEDVFWGVRHSNLTPGTVKKSTILIAKTCALLSKYIPKKIICCSVDAVKTHIDIGYESDKFITIPNGYCLDRFKPCLDTSYLDVEFELQGSLLVGMVGRFDIQKDHMNLFSAISKIKHEYPTIKCLLVGNEMTSTNQELMTLIERSGCSEQLILLGKRTDVPFIMNKIDIHILSSLGEAFPNVIAEAMACGTPCVSTDVGDASLIVGDTGWIVPAQDSNALASALRNAFYELLSDSMLWNERQILARKQIVNKFELGSMVDFYIQVWRGGK
ncbi:glycosyltransferase [Pseudoalteromonas sp. NEC-BIFX-2020_002]|uniref:glycosyltransferase family 4 protein n=1 Tax=Pseudoalteromonas sp. NEC-BIFX-2020_002 TaxID=2732353 RepID=UPI0014769FD0|nr:glycosyltransferase [Pseudoalteromonas sp. NEC-BIFX-2020_002]NNG45156.1 glycosyltransferase [Pseudoalteromonas sp. NEC-BIFX-2020_002]